IEPGEIEAVLLALPGVREAVVVVSSDGSGRSDRSVGSPGHRRLVAYVAADVAVEELRRSLRERLRDYMVPAAFVTLAALPLTANGKVDRGALPAPEQPGAESGYVAPRTREEEILAAVWAQVLRLPRVGVDDNFFELGGDSIVSVQIVARARQAGLVFTVKQIFEHPTVAGLARHAAALETPFDLPRASEEIYPLTPLQSGMLFHSLMAPESGVYVNQVTCTLPADLDVSLFRQAWEKLVERHTVLRTAFLWEGLEEPRQAVRKSVSLPWQELDWHGLPAEEQERRFEGLRQSERQTPLPLSSAPLMRFSLVRLDRELGFVWTFHHLLLDGWSQPLLVRELEAVYAALEEGREPMAPILPPVRPFSDYIAWLEEQDAAEAEPFWRGELAGFTAPNRLGIDRPAGGEEASGDGEHRLEVSREVTAELQALAARHHLTLQTVTLGAWGLLVGRYSGEEDVVFGSTVSGRPAALPGVETMIGLFINTLPVRVRVNGAEPLAAWLRRLQERQLARQELEHTPLARIQRWSEVPAGSPLFETLYVFENYPDAGDAGPGRLRIGNLRSLESTNYPVTLELTVGDRISLRLTSDRARVDEIAAPRLLRHLATLLAGMAEGPERNVRRVGELGLLSPAERHQVIAEWNDTSQEPLDGVLVHEAISGTAGRSPGALAVAWDGGEVAYAELERRSNQLARHLRRLGVGPEVFVGLCCDRSGDLVVGALGILKAGGAYVPLDPEYPEERLRHMLADCGAPVLVAQERTGGLAAVTGARLVPIDAPALGLEEDGPVPPVALPESPAYLIYTSGSTGRPKGVVVTHGALARSTRARRAFYRAPVEAYLLASSFSFDSSVAGLFWTLWDGGTLVLHRDQSRLDLPDFLATLERRRASHLLCLPSLYSLILEHAQPGQLASLTTVIVAGEACPPALVAQHAAQLPAVALVNEYGPTEGTVWSSACALDPSRVVSIGRP
ncbi:non-ribosomal peptide synthetase, partial [bacterium]